MVDKLIELPVYVQLVLVTGYIGYTVANQGFREGERKDELLYGILVYGLIGWLVFYYVQQELSSFAWVFIIAALAAASVCWGAGLLWRRWGRKWYFELLYRLRLTTDNSQGSLWNRLQQDTGIWPTQMVVTMMDGTKLCCDAVQDFDNAAVRLFETDQTGNIALYVNRKKKPDWENWKTVESVRSDSWGDNLTYIPSREVRYVEVRYLKKKR
ncbi:hypothetical protein ACL7TT_17260 [Microbulbifer sp. 2304DJ12-6]|uniref:hypothetical protein n=1 Tax=Microbulbifer sp. 2304DJ12-6 TaxID=3233340 RepID=UPI0039AEA195